MGKGYGQGLIMSKFGLLIRVGGKVKEVNVVG